MSAEKPLPPGVSEALESGEDLAALELLGLLEEIAWHFGALDEEEQTFAQPYSSAETDRLEPLPLVEIIEEVARRAAALPEMPDKPSDYADTLTSLGILAERLAASEEALRALRLLNGSLREILDAEGYR